MMRTIILTLLFISAAITKGTAQPFNLDKKIKPVEIKLLKFQPKGKQKGKLAVLKAYQVGDTAYYFCKGLSIYGITQITVANKNANTPLQVSLHKDSWKKASKAISPNKSKLYEASFKTEGSFGLMVVSNKKPAVYNIYVWVSDDLKPTLPSPFVSK